MKQMERVNQYKTDLCNFFDNIQSIQFEFATPKFAHIAAKYGKAKI